jgi:hypothetical protein
MGRFLAVFVLICFVVLVFFATLGLGIRLIDWAFST